MLRYIFILIWGREQFSSALGTQRFGLSFSHAYIEQLPLSVSVYMYIHWGVGMMREGVSSFV